MTDNFCTSIIQLDPNICSVTRSAGQLLENAQRCQFEDESAPIVNEEPSLLRFRVRDLTERYQYELTSDPSHYQLTFSMNEDHLTILVRNRQIDVVNLVDRIARLSYRNQSASAITRTQRSSEANCRTPIPVLQQATAV